MSRDLRDRIFRWVFGMVFAGCGILILYLTITNNLSNGNSTVMGFLAGLMFIIGGIWASGLLEYFIRNHELLHGCFIAFMGLMLVVFSLIDEPESFHAPRWVVTAAGLTFAVPGVWIALGSLPSSFYLKDLLMAVLRNLIVTFFALAAIGVVFSIASEPNPEWQGVICFTPGAVILTWMTFKLWRPTLKHFRAKLATTDPAQRRQVQVFISCLVVGLVAVVGLFVMAVMVENGGVLFVMPTPAPR